MNPTVEAAVVAGVVSFVVGVVTSGVSLLIYRYQTLTEGNAVRTARKLLNQEHFPQRTFELLKRRIGGFEDDDLRKILVRAGAVRFYRAYRQVYLADHAADLNLTDEQLAWITKQDPVELWGLANRQPNIAFLLGQHISEQEYVERARGFPDQLK